jgi:hypothetical protein
MKREERILEYACHEGNYSMESMIAAGAQSRDAK